MGPIGPMALMEPKRAHESENQAPLLISLCIQLHLHGRLDFAVERLV